MEPAFIFFLFTLLASYALGFASDLFCQKSPGFPFVYVGAWILIAFCTLFSSGFVEFIQQIAAYALGLATGVAIERGIITAKTIKPSKEDYIKIVGDTVSE